MGEYHPERIWKRTELIDHTKKSEYFVKGASTFPGSFQKLEELAAVGP